MLERLSGNGFKAAGKVAVTHIEYFGARIKTKDITSASYMFDNNQTIEEIPFSLNFKEGTGASLQNMFYQTAKLRKAPKFTNCKATNLTYLFYGCTNLRELPEDFVNGFDWSYMDLTSNAGLIFSKASLYTSKAGFPVSLERYLMFALLA